MKDWPSSITLGIEEEQNLYGANFERISDLASNVLKTLSNKDLLDKILNQQLLIFQKTFHDASLKWSYHIDEISKNETYNKLFKDYTERQSLGDLFDNKRAAKIQTLFYRSMYLELLKKFHPSDNSLLEKFKFNSKEIINYSSYPHSEFSETTYTVTKFDLIMKAHVNTNLTESNAQLKDIFYIMMDILSKTKSICMQNSSHIETYSLQNTYITNYYLNFLGIKKLKYSLIDSIKHTIKLKLLSYKKEYASIIHNVKRSIINFFKEIGLNIKFYFIRLISIIFKL